MKFLIDANISYRLVKPLQEIFPHTMHVSKTGLTQPAKDSEIWIYAKQNNYTILTFDDGFKILENVYGHPPKVILFCTGNSSTSFIFSTIKSKSAEIAEFISTDSKGVFEIY